MLIFISKNIKTLGLFSFLKTIFIFSVFFLFLLIPITQAETNVKKPYFISVDHSEIKNNSLHITGGAYKNTDILVYLNGKYVKRANIKEINNDKFFFSSFLNRSLEPGQHQIKILAQDRNSLKLSPATVYEFKIPHIQEKKTTAPDPKKEQKPLSPLAPPSPVVFSPILNKNNPNKPLIAGITKNQTRVNLYINGKLAQQTPLLTHSSGSPVFYYKPPDPLSSGRYEVTAIAENIFGNFSKKSKNIFFTIPSQTPLPTIFTPQKGEKLTNNNFLISGIAAKDSYIKFYIDDTLVGEVKTEKHPPGFFFFVPEKKLSRGNHSLYVIATKKGYLKSEPSSKKIFTIHKPLLGEGGTSTSLSGSNINNKKSSVNKNNTLKQGAVNSQEKNDLLSFIIFFFTIVLVSLWCLLINKEKS
jgi:hypothetical protein